MQNTESQNTNPATSERGESIAWRWLPVVALLTAIAATVANVIVYFAASALGFISQSVLVPAGSGESPLTVGMVVTTSVVATVGASVVFALIGLFARRPVRLFRIVSVVVLVLSLVPPVTLPGVPVAMKLSLALMHVVSWAVIVGLLTTLARRQAGA